LIIQSHSKLGIVGKNEDVLQNLYAYFFYSPKIIQEFFELINIVATRGQWSLKNIKTHYISMMLLIKIILSK
jgi:hypothetical protein